jgi:hypothetical protein
MPERSSSLIDSTQPNQKTANSGFAQAGCGIKSEIRTPKLRGKPRKIMARSEIYPEYRDLPRQSRVSEMVSHPSGFPEPSPMLERVLNLIHELEQSLPAKFIYTRKTLLPVIRALRKNELVAIAVDGLAGQNRVEVTVHGRQVSFSTGPVAIAKRTGAVVLPVFVLRRKSAYQHKVIIDPPLELIDTGDEMADLKVNTQHLADRFAEMLAMYPCQYARLFGYPRPYFIKNS